MTSKIILTTGANRGIGLCIIRNLLQRDPQNTFILCSRSHADAQEAIRQLRETWPQAHLHALTLDVSNDNSISTAVTQIRTAYGKLDVLINNAGHGAIPKPDHSDLRKTYSQVFDINITSVAAMTYAFTPLLKQSSDPRVINITSGRASITNLTTGNMPPTASIPYSVSKTALNVLTFEMAKTEKDVLFQLANPGHCKTAFNGYRGIRDPMDGAKVVVELVLCERGAYKAGYWREDAGQMIEMPW